MHDFHAGMFEAFPDLSYHVDRLVAGEGTIVAECTIKGTHRNPMMGIPSTNKHISLPAAFVVDVDGGQVRKLSSYFDSTSMRRQLGLAK